MLHYATVDRPDGKTRDLYVQRVALEALQRGQALPIGAWVAIQTHQAQPDGAGGYLQKNGRLQKQKSDPFWHAMRKQSDFGSNSWQFAAFNPLNGQNEPGVDLPSDCRECHSAALSSDLLFSLDLLQAFAQTQQVQYKFCNQPGRQLC